MIVCIRCMYILLNKMKSISINYLKYKRKIIEILLILEEGILEKVMIMIYFFVEYVMISFWEDERVYFIIKIVKIF